MKRLIALTTAIALATVAYVTPTGAASETPTASTVSTATSSDVIVDWSRIVFEAAMTDDGYVSFMGTRHQAMTHIAMHDALNAIDPRFEQYAYFGRSKHANPVAAAAKAAHDVLVAVYPAQQATLDAELATWLATVPNGSAKTKALTLGAKAAAAIVALRQDDGTDVDLLSPDYTPGNQPGDYQFVPPYDFTFAEDFRDATPFGLKSPQQFRVSKPPKLTSRTYARAYNEVKSVGAINSTTRTTDQSNYANWWYEGSEIGWARIARVTATSEELELWRAARMFALVNMSSTTATLRAGIPSSTGTSGGPTPRSEPATPTATPAPSRTPPGRPISKPHRSRTTPRPTASSAPERPKSSSEASGPTTCPSRWTPRPRFQRAPSARSTPSPRQPTRTPIRA